MIRGFRIVNLLQIYEPIKISNQKERNWPGMQHDRCETGEHLEDLGVNERIILKCILNNTDVKAYTESVGTG